MANASANPNDPTQITDQSPSFDETLRKIGPDATATFDNSPSNPTEHASSEATNAATAVEGEDETLDEEDDDAAEEEEDDEEDEEEDVDDEAGV
jgi:hypothetical protein